MKSSKLNKCITVVRTAKAPTDRASVAKSNMKSVIECNKVNHKQFV